MAVSFAASDFPPPAMGLGYSHEGSWIVQRDALGTWWLALCRYDWVATGSPEPGYDPLPGAYPTIRLYRRTSDAPGATWDLWTTIATPDDLTQQAGHGFEFAAWFPVVYLAGYQVMPDGRHLLCLGFNGDREVYYTVGNPCMSYDSLWQTRWAWGDASGKTWNVLPALAGKVGYGFGPFGFDVTQVGALHFWGRQVTQHAGWQPPMYWPYYSEEGRYQRAPDVTTLDAETLPNGRLYEHVTSGLEEVLAAVPPLVQQTWYMMDWRSTASAGAILCAPTAALYVMSYSQFGPARVSADWGTNWQVAGSAPSYSPYYAVGGADQILPLGGVGRFQEIHALWAGYTSGVPGDTATGTWYNGEAHLTDDPLSMYYLDHPPAAQVCPSSGSSQIVLEPDGALSAFVRPSRNNSLQWHRSRDWGGSWEVVDGGFAY